MAALFFRVLLSGGSPQAIGGHGVCCLPSAMPEVGLGAALERFELVAQATVCCTIDIVDSQTASIVLPSLPEFPLEIDAVRARQFVAAWRERNNIQSQPYEVHEEQREV